MRAVVRSAASVALLALLKVSLVASLRVESAGISKVSPSSVSPGQQHEDLEQRWLVRASGDREDTLTSIAVSSDCQVYVSHATAPSDSPGALATVRVIGSDATAIQRLVAVDATPDKTGELRVSGATTAPETTVDIDGFVRVEVEIHDGVQLNTIKVSGKGDVIVEAPGALSAVPVDSLTIEASGSGDIFLSQQLPVAANVLHVRVSGVGSVYLSAKELSVDSAKVVVDGGGQASIGVTGLMTAKTSLTASVRGNGALKVVAAQLQTPLLNAVISGSGAVSIASGDSALPVGHCEYQASGVGHLNAGGVCCSHATVSCSGAGNASVRVQDAMSYRVSGIGSIYYVDPAPESMAPSPGYAKRAVRSLGSVPEPIGSTWIDPPPRETTHVTLHGVAAGGEDGNDVAVDNNDENDANTPEIPATSREVPSKSAEVDDKTASSSNVGWLLLGVIIAYTVWDHTKRCQRQRDLRNETTPLRSSQPSPVYI